MKLEETTKQNDRDIKRTRRTQKGQSVEKEASRTTKQSMIYKNVIHFPKPLNVGSANMYQLKQCDHLQLTRLRDTDLGQRAGLATESRAICVNIRAKTLGTTDSKYTKTSRKKHFKKVGVRFEN